MQCAFSQVSPLKSAASSFPVLCPALSTPSLSPTHSLLPLFEEWHSCQQRVPMPSAVDVLWQPRPRVRRPTGPPCRTDHLAAPVMGTRRPAFTVRNTERRGIITNIRGSCCKRDKWRCFMSEKRVSCGISATGPTALRTTQQGKGHFTRILKTSATLKF